MMMVAHGLLYAEGQCDRSVAFSLKIGVKQVKGEFRRQQDLGWIKILTMVATSSFKADKCGQEPITPKLAVIKDESSLQIRRVSDRGLIRKWSCNVAPSQLGVVQHVLVSWWGAGFSHQIQVEMATVVHVGRGVQHQKRQESSISIWS